MNDGSVNEPRKYTEWRTPGEGRWRDVFHTFGHHAMGEMVAAAVDEVIKDSVGNSEVERQVLERTARASLYRLMMILEGITMPDLGTPDVYLEFSLCARVRRTDGDATVVEEFEIGPSSEEPLCMGYHFWTEDGDFRG